MTRDPVVGTNHVTTTHIMLIKCNRGTGGGGGGIRRCEILPPNEKHWYDSPFWYDSPCVSLGQPEFVSGPFHIWATVLDLGYCSHDPFRKIFGKS